MIVFGFAVLLLISIYFVNEDRKRKINTEINQRNAAFIQQINETLRFSVENLQSASNVIVYFKNITIEQFQGITTRNFDSDPGLLIIEWQPIVKGDLKEQFIRKARLGGLTNFRLWEPDKSGNPIPVSFRDEHVPVYFMRSRNIANDQLDTLGLDLAWSKERMESKWQARGAGRARSSEFFNVVTGPNSDYAPLGFAITLPVYNQGLVPSNRLDRQKDIIGYMAGVYSLEDLIKNEIKDFAEQGLNIDIHDERNDEHRLSIQSGIESQYTSKMGFDLYGIKINVCLNATKEFIARQFELIWIALPLSMAVFGIVTFILFRRIELKNHQLDNAQTDLKAVNSQLEESVLDLKKALADVKTLSGLLPICSHCKKVRDDQGYWNSIESYLDEHSDAKLSHGICQDCATKYYPDFGIYDEE